MLVEELVEGLGVGDVEELERPGLGQVPRRRKMSVTTTFPSPYLARNARASSDPIWPAAPVIRMRWVSLVIGVISALEIDR